MQTSRVSCQRFRWYFSSLSRLFATGLLSSLCLMSSRVLSAQEAGLNPTPLAIGAGNVIVNSKFGGQIFGFDIDQNGTEGVLTESQLITGGLTLSAIETFDQKTGVILKVEQELQSKDDFLTLGVVGNGIGLVEREHVKKLFVDSRTYSVLRPLGVNKITGRWTPPLPKSDVIISMSRSQGVPNAAVLVDGSSNRYVFGSNIGSNTFGRKIILTNPVFSAGLFPAMAYDTKTNSAVVAESTGARGGPPPVIAIVNLSTGKTTEFLGLPGSQSNGPGSVNGIAVDSADGIACTTTEFDGQVEFYDLKKKSGFSVTLPNFTSELQGGMDVEFDPVHKLFFVAQPTSSTSSGSSIQVYDTKGNLVESLNGFNFSNFAAAIFVHIALNPLKRSGFIDGPSNGVTQIQSFTY